ncbi:hypothetical protein BDW69DRAFT_186424 [Aspergillus filifer]
MSALNAFDQVPDQKNDGSVAFAPLLDEVIAARKASERNVDIYAWLDHLHESREQSAILFSYCCPVEGCSHGHITFSDAAALDGHMQAYHPTWEPTEMRQQEKLFPYRWNSKVAGEGPAPLDYMMSDQGADDVFCNTTAGFSADKESSLAKSEGSGICVKEYNAHSTVGVLDSNLIEGDHSSAKRFRITPVIHTIDGDKYLAILPGWKAAYKYQNCAVSKLETYYGAVAQTRDAVLLVEACRTGLLSSIPPDSYQTSLNAERPGSVRVFLVEDFANEGLLEADDDSVIPIFFLMYSRHKHTFWHVQDPRGMWWVVEWYDLNVENLNLNRPERDPLFARIHHMLMGPQNPSGVPHCVQQQGKGNHEGGRSRGSQRIEASPTNIPADSGYASSMSRARGNCETSNKEQHPEDVKISVDGMSSEAVTMDTDVREESETESIYSDVSAISDSKMGYLSELADELVNVVQPYQFDEDVMRKVSNALPALLKAFALSLGHGQSTAMHREAMVFIHKYRRDVVTAFNERLLENRIKSQRPRAGNDMSLYEIMDLWQKGNEATQYEPPGPTDFEFGHIEGRYSGPMASSDLLEKEAEHVEDEKADGQEGEEKELPRLETYRKLIQDSPTYTWLLSGIRNECILYTPGRGISTEIRNAILEALPVYARVSRRSSTETLSACFRIHWDPIYHIDSEWYDSLRETSIERALTFTGSGSDLQAESCGTYMRRTWPSTGEAVLQLLTRLVSTEHTGTVTLADGTRVGISLQSSPNGGPLMDTLVNIRGTAACIAEIGEQLSWVASAIQTTRDEKTCICSKPFVKSAEAGHIYNSGARQYYFEIGVEKYGLESNPERCWFGLVSRPAIVEGYPILRRPPDCPPGLEVQLGVIIHLLGTRKVRRFYEKTVLKGFSTMLVPTRSKEEFVHWHFLEEKDGKRISYNRCMDFPEVDLSIDQLERARHIVGWCPEVRLYAGEIDANYSVSDSRLPRQDGLRILKNASLSLDHVITDELSVSLGRKDVRVRRDGYMRKMKWISGKYMTLWDSGEKRSWFLNGATGLLHIVRASLERERSDTAFRSAISLKPEDIHEAAESHRSHAALEVLLNIHNLNLRVYHVDADITFKNRVEDCYDQLEKLFDYQTIGLRKDQNVPRSCLEGWDFQDLAHERDPIYPRHTTLHEEGLSWVDFTRSINAITLFGRDFGELIRPVNICSKSSAITPGKSFLVAAVSDLNKVMASNGDLFSTPIRLTQDTLWYVAESTSFRCLCEHSGQNHRAPAIQSLLPYSMRDELPTRPPGNRGHNGAVIFGFDTRNKWFWGEFGPPSRTPAWLNPDTPMKESRSVYSDDSGLGRSLSSSGDINSIAPTGLSSQEDQRQWQRLQVPARPVQTTDRKSEGYSSSSTQYKVGIVCALHIELMAVRALFDVSHPAVRIPDEDPNYYVFGRIQGHNTVAVCLPHGFYGTSAATDVASHMRRSFPSLKFCLLVGIGAGVPSSKNDIRLGDVVVSAPSGHYSGVLPYDMVKSLEAGELQLNGYMSPPPQTLMCAISELESDPNLSSAPLEKYLREIQSRKPQYAHPGADRDQLFESDYHHATEHDTCEKCSSLHTIERPPRLAHHQRIFYGLIASGNKLVRSAHEREKLGKEHNVLCIEMEGAGIMNTFPCLIIRGICDYADSHKNKIWQNYASAAAAAYAKLLLSRVRTMDDSGSSSSAEAEADIGADGGPSRKRLRLPDWEDELPNKRLIASSEASDEVDMEDARVNEAAAYIDSHTKVMDVQ